MGNTNIELIVNSINLINQRKEKIGDRNYLSAGIVRTINDELHTSPFFCIEKLNSEEVKRAIEHINQIYPLKKSDERLSPHEYLDSFFEGLEILRLEREAEQSQYGE